MAPPESALEVVDTTMTEDGVDVEVDVVLKVNPEGDCVDDSVDPVGAPTSSPVRPPHATRPMRANDARLDIPDLTLTRKAAVGQAQTRVRRGLQYMSTALCATPHFMA